MRKLKFKGTGLYMQNKCAETELGICFNDPKERLSYWFPKKHIRYERSLFGFEVMIPDWMRKPTGKR